MFSATSEESNGDSRKDLAEEKSELLFEGSVEVTDMNSPAEQMHRDYQLIKGAIENPGENQFSGEILKKIYALLYVGEFYYFKNNKWHKWDTAPIVAALCHGSRIIIQLDNTVSDEAFFYWLFPEEEYNQVYRHAATHGLKIGEEKNLIGKKVVEEKFSVWKAGFKAGADSLYARMSPSTKYTPKHYGINLAVGGAGSQHQITRNVISNNGKHGHLYLHHRPSTNKDNEPTAWLVGIEQSAPGYQDQQGGNHSLFATRSKLSATDGTYFGEGRWKEEKGVPDVYYDSLFLLVTSVTIHLAKQWSQKPNLEWLNCPCWIPPTKKLPEKPKRKRRKFNKERLKESEERKKNNLSDDLASDELLDISFFRLSPQPRLLEKLKRPKREKKKFNKPKSRMDKQKREESLSTSYISDKSDDSLCLTEEKKADQPIRFDRPKAPPKGVIQVSEEKRDLLTNSNKLSIVSPPEFKLSTDPAQKDVLDNAALICFSVGIIGSCIIIGTIWYTGSAFVVGFSLINAAWLVPLIAIMGSVYYCYQSAQFTEMLAIERILEDSLKKPGLQNLQNLATDIHKLNVSSNIKKQLYNQFQNEIKDKKNLKAEKVCQNLIDAENKKHFSYCRLFSGRPNQQIITALEEYKKTLSP